MVVCSHSKVQESIEMMVNMVFNIEIRMITKTMNEGFFFFTSSLVSAFQTRLWESTKSLVWERSQNKFQVNSGEKQWRNYIFFYYISVASERMHELLAYDTKEEEEEEKKEKGKRKRKRNEKKTNQK